MNILKFNMKIADCRVCAQRILAYEFSIVFMELSAGILKMNAVLEKESDKAEHQKSNAEVDFEISTADMEILKHIERIKDYGDASFFPVFGGKL